MDGEFKIDIKAFFRIVKSEKWIIIFVASIFTSIALLYSITAREEFESYGKILPEISGKSSTGLGQFAGLASLAGVDLNSFSANSIDAVRPDLYPDLLSSTPFLIELLNTEVTTKENKKEKFEHFYFRTVEKLKEPKMELINVLSVKKNDIILVNKLTEARIKDLKKRIFASIDRKSGIITINCKMPDPVVAADVTAFAMKYVINYVKKYRTEKLVNDVEYLKNQVDNSRGRYYSSQEKKARYSDQYQDMMLQSADVQRERIESEYRLSSSFYNELLKKYEEAKFKLHQETPVLKILEPPVVPNFKSEPKRRIIVTIGLLGGIFVGVIYSLIIKNNYRKLFIR